MMNRSPPFAGTGVPIHSNLAGISSMGSPMFAATMRPSTGVLGPGLSPSGSPIIPMARMHPAVGQPAPVIHAMSAQPMMTVQPPQPQFMVQQQQPPPIQLVPSPPQIIQQPAPVQLFQQPAPVQLVQAPQPQYQVVQPAPLPVQVVSQQPPVQVLQVSATQPAHQPAQVVQVSPRGQPPAKVVHVVSNTAAKKPSPKVVYIDSQHPDDFPISGHAPKKVVYMPNKAQNSSKSANRKVIYVDADFDEEDYTSRHQKYKGSKPVHHRKNSYKMEKESGQSPPPSPSPPLLDDDAYITSTPMKPRVRRSSNVASTQTDQPTQPTTQTTVQQQVTQPMMQQPAPQPIQQQLAAQPIQQQPAAQPVQQQSMMPPITPSQVYPLTTQPSVPTAAQMPTQIAATQPYTQPLDQTTNPSLGTLSQSVPSQHIQQPLSQQLPGQPNMQSIAQFSMPQTAQAIPNTQIPPSTLPQAQPSPLPSTSPPAAPGSSQIDPSAVQPGAHAAATPTSLNYMLPPQEPYPSDSYGTYQQQQQQHQQQQNEPYRLSESMHSLNFTEDQRVASHFFGGVPSQRSSEQDSSSILSAPQDGAYSSIHDDGYQTQDSTILGHGLHHTSPLYMPQGYTGATSSTSSHPLLQASYSGTRENIQPQH